MFTMKNRDIAMKNGSGAMKGWVCVVRNVCLVLCTVLMCAVLMSACKDEAEDRFLLDGAWSLTHLSYPMGTDMDFPHDGKTLFRIYEGDSVLYKCQLLYTGSGIVVVPLGIRQVTLKDVGGGRYVYMEDDDLCPLVVLNDSSVTTQHYGCVHTWVRASGMSEEKVAEIRDIIRNDQGNDADEWVRHYVLSTTERRLKADNHRLWYVLGVVVFVLVVVVWWGVAKNRKARRIALRLREIEVERELRPSPVRKAMAEVEQEFFESDYYQGLLRDLSEGRRLVREDWEEMERRLNGVYPNFTKHLLSLYPMSEVEFQISLLVKLRVSPKCIAGVLMKDVSSVSSTRSRLYRKIFNKAGSSKDWDDFVLSLGC